MKSLIIAAVMAVLFWAGFAYANETRCGPIPSLFKAAFEKGQAPIGGGASDSDFALILFIGNGYTLMASHDATTACVLDSGPVWRWSKGIKI